MTNARRHAVTLVRAMVVLTCLLQWNASVCHGQAFDARAPGNDRIVPGDELEVQVEDAPELSKTYTVNASGTFLMRYLGAITAQQRTERELADAIAQGLRGRYLKEPKVSVRVIRPSGPVKNLLGATDQYYFIQGAVRNAGAYRIEGRATLLKLIALAGGLTNTHGPIAYVIHERPNKGTVTDRRDNADPEYTTRTVNIEHLVKDAAIVEPVALERGDVVNIPVANIFFVAGEVGSPGSFPFDQGMTLRRAIDLARGLTANAAASRGVIFREDRTTGKRSEINVDIAAIMSGKKKDVAIQPYDIIAVPSSRTRSMYRFQYLDSPPIPRVTPCRRSGPCIA